MHPMKQRNQQLNPCHWRERELGRDRLKGSKVGSPIGRDAVVFMGGCFVVLVAMIALADLVGPATPSL